MAIYPGAAIKLIPKHKTPLKASQVIMHTAVSDAASLYGFFSTDPLCSHFYVREDGTVEQYVDTKFQAPANRNANDSAISIESWDGRKPDVTPWTPAQVVSIVKLILWANKTHGVPLRLCSSPTAAGVGWHAMWGAPSDWTPARGKTCPGPARIPQIAGILALANRPVVKSSGDDDFMAVLSDGEKNEFMEAVRGFNRAFNTPLPSKVDGKPFYFTDFVLFIDKSLGDISKALTAIKNKFGA